MAPVREADASLKPHLRTWDGIERMKREHLRKKENHAIVCAVWWWDDRVSPPRARRSLVYFFSHFSSCGGSIKPIDNTHKVGNAQIVAFLLELPDSSSMDVSETKAKGGKLWGHILDEGF